MSTPIRVEVVECRGSAYECGAQLARAFLGTPRGRAFGRRKERTPFGFSLNNAKATLERWAPNLWDELNGIADGLEIPLKRAVAEFGNGRLRWPKMGCSAVMAGGAYGRNYDFEAKRYDRRLIAMQATGAYAHLGFSERFAGRLDGMNEKGLCVGLHFVNEKTWAPGLVCLLVVRIVLDQCASTREAVALLRRLPHGLGFNYSLIDAGGEAAVVEAAPGRVAVREGAALACTNHFQSAEMQDGNRRALRNSLKRLPALQAWAAEAPGAAALYARLNDSASPVFQHGYARGGGTLHTMACEPAARTMLAGVGGDAEPVRIDLAAWAAGAPLGFAALDGRLGGRAADGRSFRSADLSGAVFHDVNLAGARFDDINFAGAEIGANCNFKDMRIAGVPLAELFAVWRARNGG